MSSSAPQPSEMLEETLHHAQHKQIYAKVKRKVVPFLILLYIVAFLDRVNVSFASLTMNHDLGISDDLFGLGAGIFFVGYLIFAVPSNVMLSRFGARRWIGFIMVLWGLLSCGMAFIIGPRTYVALRFLIGAAEAGFFPGVILYLTLWLPGPARASIMALFTFSIPLSNVIGAPLSEASSRGRVHLAGAPILGGAGMGIVAMASDWRVALGGLSFAAVGILTAMPIFWAAFSQGLTRAESAVSIAAVNSVGNAGGFVGPYLIGWLLKSTHQYRSGLLVTTACLLFAGMLTIIRRKPSYLQWKAA